MGMDIKMRLMGTSRGSGDTGKREGGNTTRI